MIGKFFNPYVNEKGEPCNPDYWGFEVTSTGGGCAGWVLSGYGKRPGQEGISQDDILENHIFLSQNLTALRIEDWDCVTPGDPVFCYRGTGSYWERDCDTGLEYEMMHWVILPDGTMKSTDEWNTSEDGWSRKDEPEEEIVNKILELDSPHAGRKVRAESSTGPSEEQSLILSTRSFEGEWERDSVWIDRKQWEALVALVPDLIGWEGVPTLEGAIEWLEGEVSMNDGSCYESKDSVYDAYSFESGVLAGRLECASALLAHIDKGRK